MNKLDVVDIWPYQGSFCSLDFGALLSCMQVFIKYKHLPHGYMQSMGTT